MIDIHNHILFGVDDGAKSLEESLKMLKAAKKQGINTVIATPHFYSFDTDIDGFKTKVESNFKTLTQHTNGDDFPEIYLGYEVHYFNDIFKSDEIKSLTLNNSEFLLLELDHNEITNKVLNDIEELRWQLGVKPIIAHLERYSKCKGYSKLLSILDHENFFAQITADSLFINRFKKISLKLIKKNIVDFIASDAHNNAGRPFYLSKAYDFISEKIGKNTANKILSKSQIFFSR